MLLQLQHRHSTGADSGATGVSMFFVCYAAVGVVCSAPPFVPYKPVPRLVPLPDRHTLVVARPESKEAASWGHLRNDNLQLILTAQVSTRAKKQ